MQQPISTHPGLWYQISQVFVFLADKVQTAIFLPIIFTSLLYYLITDIQTAKYEKISSMRSSWCRTGPFQSPDGADLVQNVDGSVWIQCGQLRCGAELG